MNENELQQLCRLIATQAKVVSRALAVVEPQRKIEFLTTLTRLLRQSIGEITSANEKDLSVAPGFGLSAAQVDRLRLDPGRIEAMAQGVDQVANLPEPIGRVLESTVRPNGLRIDRVSVPLGVIFFLYESRPNVTIDAAAIAIKSGNAIILRGGKEARHTNFELHRLIVKALHAAGIATDAVQMVPTIDREAVGHLLKMNGLIDLVIPRGGESLIERVTKDAAMAVMKHFRGNCHVYVDVSADLEMAERIVINAKCQRPGVCNAAESLLVHQSIANQFLPSIGKSLIEQGVEIRACPQTCRLIVNAIPATDGDYGAEFLDLVISIRVVDSIDQAMDHIAQFGSRHTEAIVTNDLSASQRFINEVDAAAVVVNASTRFHDGFEFGLGAEIGISTDKFHARGPCGLRELTSYKYLVYGSGQTRK